MAKVLRELGSTKQFFWFMADDLTNSVPDFKLSEEELDRIKKGAKEATEEEYLKELGRQHAKDSVLTDDLIAEVFPEEQKLVVDKLQEYWDEAAEVYKEVLMIRNLVDKVQTDPFSKWFFINADKYDKAKRLKELYQNIKRLQRQKVVYEKKQLDKLFQFAKFDTKEERKKYNIDRMFEREGLLVDIVTFDGIRLRGTGSRFMGLCPFHTETTASFVVYPDNWYHCFGCQAHGNFINYLMQKHKLSFKEALAEADRFL